MATFFTVRCDCASDSLSISAERVLGTKQTARFFYSPLRGQGQHSPCRYDNSKDHLMHKTAQISFM